MFGAQEQPGVPNSALRKVQTSKPQHNFSRKATVTVTVDGAAASAYVHHTYMAKVGCET